MSLTSLTKRITTSSSLSSFLSSSTNFNGFHHHSSTTLRSSYSARQLRRQRIVPFTRQQQQQMRIFQGNSEMACDVWDEMVQRGCCPDENAYTVLIGGLIRQGRSEDACKYVEEMINKGMRVPELDFNKFATDFSRVGRPNILDELARKLRLSGKSEVSEIFARWAQMTQKRGTRRGSFDTDA